METEEFIDTPTEVTVCSCGEESVNNWDCDSCFYEQDYSECFE